MKSVRFFGSCFMLLFFVILSAKGQSDSAITAKGLQVSLLTCGTGAEIYSVFGHTAVRIVDSAKGTDIVYNYGTFDGYDENFEMKFMQGKLLYYLSEDDYPDFIDFYGADGRWVNEQVLNIGETEKKQIQQYLTINLMPENRAYKYDFFFDNCATRIRDIFTQTHGDAFRYPNVLPEGKALSFRDIINRYLAANVWERFGINILLGSKIDKAMTNSQIMFLPDYLSDGVGGATLNGKPYAAKAQQIVAGDKNVFHPDYSLQLVLYSLLFVLALGLFIPRLHLLGAFLANFMLIVTGLLGVLILVMWFGTDHQACAGNFNLLWALPTNLMFVFRKRQYKYALIALLLIFVALILHVAGIQQLLLPDMVPLLLMLVLIFATAYKKYKNVHDGKNPLTA